MARPKANLGADSADNRIKEAYWKILRKGTYADVTIKRIAIEAGVNHKTIYYHYANVDEMAKQLFWEIQESIDVDHLIGALLLNGKYKEYISDRFLNDKMSRAWLYTREDSGYLTGIFKDYIIDAWLRFAGIQRSDLSDEDIFDLNFIISGLTASIGNAVSTGHTDVLKTLPNRNLGNALTGFLQDIVVRYGQKSNVFIPGI